MTSPIPMEKFGRDHWSILTYVAHIALLNVPVDPSRMRTDPSVHPQFVNPDLSVERTAAFPTRLKGTEQVNGHDDWSCLDDLEAAGLLESQGTGLHRLYDFTTAGRDALRLLIEHKRSGRSYATFSYEHRAIAVRRVTL